MSNVWTIAKKEFTDLISSRLVILILGLYVIIFIFSFYNFYGSIDIAVLSSQSYAPHDAPDIIANPAGTFASTLISIVCYFGSLLGVVLGYSSMSSEADGKALSTLLIKPLYRDTIINGKLVGASCFLLCIFLVSVAFYLCGLFLLFGGVIGANFLEFMSMLPLVFILYMLGSMLTFSLSMLACIWFKEQSFALFLSFLAWMMLFYIIDTYNWSGYVLSFLNLGPASAYLINSILPGNIFGYIGGDLISGKGIIDVLSSNFSEIVAQIFALSLYCFVIIISAYSSFIRRDVS